MTDETRALIEAEKNAPAETQIAGAFQDKKTEPVKTDELIEASINTAIISRITTDEKVQEKFKRTADTVIDNKLETEQANAEKVAKKAHLQNNQDACDLYGIDENTVPKWVVNVANKAQNFWYGFWLLAGFFTVAPIVFLSKKIKVVFKRTWISVVIAILIYLAVILTPLLTNILK